MSNKNLGIKLGTPLVIIYALEQEDSGKDVGIAIGSPLNQKEIIKLLGLAQHQMLTNPGHEVVDAEDIDNLDLSKEIAKFKSKKES